VLRLFTVADCKHSLHLDMALTSMLFALNGPFRKGNIKQIITMLRILGPESVSSQKHVFNHYHKKQIKRSYYLRYIQSKITTKSLNLNENR